MTCWIIDVYHSMYGYWTLDKMFVLMLYKEQSWVPITSGTLFCRFGVLSFFLSYILLKRVNNVLALPLEILARTKAEIKCHFRVWVKCNPWTFSAMINLGSTCLTGKCCIPLDQACLQKVLIHSKIYSADDVIRHCGHFFFLYKIKPIMLISVHSWS